MRRIEFSCVARVAAAVCLAAGAGLFPGAGFAEEPPRVPRGPLPMETSCVVCHAQLEGEVAEPVRLAAEDVHFRRNLNCADCHGGNPAAGADGGMDAAHDPKRGFKGKPERLAIPVFCGTCHADAARIKQYNPAARVDQLSEYRTSVHGQKNAAGDRVAAVCTDCHGVHGILPIKDPRSPVHAHKVAGTCARCHADEAKMAPYGIGSNQVAEYGKSVHARALLERGDLTAPTCNDCHGSHGAVPPGVDNVSNVCGSCHTREATLFRETEAKRGLDLAACIRCVICHSNHAVLPPDDSMLGVHEQSTCVGCHAPEDPGYEAAGRMAEEIAGLVRRSHEAQEMLDRAERAGMEVSEDRFALQKSRESLVEARVLVHSFDLERFLAATGEGMKSAEAGVAAGHRAFGELRTRRTGLAASLVIIAAVIAALAFKIREIEKRGG
jgi:hypothetical protein